MAGFLRGVPPSKRIILYLRFFSSSCGRLTSTTSVPYCSVTPLIVSLPVPWQLAQFLTSGSASHKLHVSSPIGMRLTTTQDAAPWATRSVASSKDMNLRHLHLPVGGSSL